MEEHSLDDMAHLFGELYESALRGSKLCTVEGCKGRHKDRECECVSIVKDVVDMIWEAKQGKPERLVAFVAEAMARGEQQLTPRPSAWRSTCGRSGTAYCTRSARIYGTSASPSMCWT